MTAAASDGLPDRPARQKWREFVGHRGYLLWVVFVVFILLTYVLSAPWSWILVILFFAIHISFFWGNYAHDRNLCWRCMKNVPLDPEKEVKRYDRSLRWLHWLTDHPIKQMLCYVGIVFTPLVIGAFVQVEGSLGIVWLSGLVVWGVTQYTLNYRHQWLRPWCPYCRRWDDGGTPEIAPDPVPSAEKEKA